MGKDTYFFRHDYHSRNDHKISALILDHGAAGYGVYWCIVEMLHEETEHKLPLQEYFYKTLAKQSVTSVEQVLNIIQDCLKVYQLFTEKDGFFYSERVFRNLEQREEIRLKRSLAGKKSAEVRKLATDAEQDSTSVEQNPTKKRKGNRKERKINDLDMPFLSPFFLTKWQRWKEFRSEEHGFKYKSSITEQAALNKLVELSGNREEIAIHIIEQSIANGYKGFFELKHRPPSIVPPAARKSYMEMMTE